MISFTPPIKASLLISFIYMLCLQLFFHTGSYVWLYPANVCFIICSVLYVQFLNRKNKTLNMVKLTSKGTLLSFISSLLSVACATIILLVNTYFFPGSKQITGGNGKDLFVMIFANGFLVNFVCGSVAAFITAGLLNERSYGVNSKHLPSVK